MSQETRSTEKGFKAGSDMLTSSKQFYIAKQTADDTVDVASAVTDALVGVIQNKAALNDTVSVAMVHGGGSCKVIAGGTISRGDYITTDSSGKAVRASVTGDKVIGIALQSAVANDIFEMALGFFRFVAGVSASPSLSPSSSASLSRSPSASQSLSPSSSISASRSPSSSASPS